MSLSRTVCTTYWRGTPEWDANARLIAAAPELLTACEAMARRLDSLRYTELPDVAGLIEDKDNGWAAIAKAKGEPWSCAGGCS